MATVEQTLDPFDRGVPRRDAYGEPTGRFDHNVLHHMEGIDMFQHINGVYYPLMDNLYNT
ncbi:MULTISPECIES: hypothetical protein [Sphingobacterium]|uniref:hypothetical protein n=1 Tax=Sphingobacterium TaxID=28453 RepID=UPI0013DD2396|nr:MULTISPECIES: hypothetical protein [unclassified Sphingobacterium]